jgi:ComF family protein
MCIAQKYFEALESLVFPQTCLGCNRVLCGREISICLHCECRLPGTLFTGWDANPVERIFWGRVQLAQATALFFFHRDSLLQALFHRLKYKNAQKIGWFFGVQLGYELLISGRFESIEGLVAVPLHPNREKLRGYNQSHLICEGVSKVTKWPILQGLERKVHTASQTDKKRYERWINVGDIFEVIDASNLKNKHILLVDDVITTGATLEASAQELIQKGVRSVSIATVGMA